MTGRKEPEAAITIGGCRADTPCHACGVKQGELHKPGCDMERCPQCYGQTILCGCWGKPKLARIPFVILPNHCGLCSEIWPRFFVVSDAEWQRVVPPNLWREVLCRRCYDSLRRLWKLRGRDGWKGQQR